MRTPVQCKSTLVTCIRGAPFICLQISYNALLVEVKVVLGNSAKFGHLPPLIMFTESSTCSIRLFG
jgi:hypothetical protein